MSKVDVGGVSPFFVVRDVRVTLAEFAANAVEFWKPLHTNSDRLRDFEVQDSDHYVLYFGKPLFE